MFSIKFYDNALMNTRIFSKLKELKIKLITNFKIIKVMKSMSKTRLNHLLLSTTFNDIF